MSERCWRSGFCNGFGMVFIVSGSREKGSAALAQKILQWLSMDFNASGSPEEWHGSAGATGLPWFAFVFHWLSLVLALQRGSMGVLERCQPNWTHNSFSIDFISSDSRSSAVVSERCRHTHIHTHTNTQTHTQTHFSRPNVW